MKNVVITISILASCVAITQAQKLKPNSTVMAKYFTYRTDSVSMRSIFVHNNKNHYHTDVSRKNSVTGDNLEINDSNSLSKILKKTFTAERLKQLHDQTLFMELFVSNDGKILEVSFVLPKNTLLTVTEIEALEMVVKTDISFRWRGRTGKEGEVFELYQPLIFRKLLD